MAEKKKKESTDFNFERGGINFGGIFKGIGDLIDLASKLGEEEVVKNGEISGLPEGAKGVYGVSVRTLGGKPVVESFGNIKGTAKGPVVEEVREPMVDIFDEENHIVVIAELPGVSEDEIKVEVIGDILNLSAGNKDRKYAKEILLPNKVDPKSMKSSYKNGILEITLNKEG